MDYIFETGYFIFQQKINILFTILQTPMRLGIACSGGPDSILLLHYIAKYKAENPEKIELLLLIHIVDGHQLIEPSLQITMQKAYDLVIQEANHLSIEYIVYTNDNTDTFFQKNSIESVCHTIRKDFFKIAKDRFNLDRILTGHTLTDQLEHFFIGIIRKTSLRRISGMQQDTSIYFRPLLFMHKKNTSTILTKINKEYVLDPCNNNILYLRNKIRQDLLPMLPTIDVRFESSIIEVMSQIHDRENFIDELVLHEYQKKEIWSISYFITIHRVIAYKIIEKILYQLKYKKTVSISLCKEIIRFLEAKQNPMHTINTIIIKKKNNIWKITVTD
jgi:tRNA(Ile)-lysidine synthase